MAKAVSTFHTFEEYKWAEFAIEPGCSYEKPWQTGVDERFVIGMIQGCPMSGPCSAHDLRAAELCIEIAQRPVWRTTADLVTVADPGAQAQIDELRSMLLHLLQMTPPTENEPTDAEQRAMKLAAAMQRLGWSSSTQDHRVPSRPLIVGPTDKFTLKVAVSNVVQQPFDLRVVIRGLRHQAVVL